MSYNRLQDEELIITERLQAEDMRMRQTKGYLATILSAVAYGSAPLMITLIYRNGFGVNSVAFYRVLFSAPVLALIVWFRRWESFRIRGKQILKIIALGVTGTVLTSMLLFQSYNHIDTGTATTIHFSYPVVVILLDMLICRRKPGKKIWIALGLCFARILMFIDPGGSFTCKGFLLALGSSFSFATYVLYLERSRIMEEMPFCSFTFWFFLISSVLMFPIALGSGELHGAIQPAGWAFMIGFALFDGLLATVLQEYGVNIVGSRAASIISAMEPVTSAALGVLFLNETMGIRNVIGIVLIIAATVYLVLRGQERPTGEGG